MEREILEKTKEIETDERREFWKACAISFLSTAEQTKEHPDSYSAAACGVADKMLEKFDQRKKVGYF